MLKKTIEKINKYISIKKLFIYLVSKANLGTFYSDLIIKFIETFATRILIICISFFTSILIIRALGPEGRGLYAVATSIGAMGVQFGNLGLHASNTYYVANNRKLLPNLIGNSLVVSFVIGGIGSLILWLLFELRPNIAPVQGILLILSITYIPFGLACLLLQNLLIGVQQIHDYNKIELVVKILSVFFIGLIIILKPITAEMIFSANLAALIIGALLSFWLLQGKQKIFPLPLFSLFLGNIRYGLKAYLAALFAFLMLRSNLLIIKYLLGAEQVGLYSAASTLSDMIYMLPSILGIILFPKLSALSDLTEKWKITRDIIKLIAIIMSFIAVIFFFLGDITIIYLFGKAFQPAIVPFKILCIGVIFLGANSIISNYLASNGFPWFSVFIWIIFFIINTILNILLIPRIGIAGASYTALICYIMIFFMQYIFSLRNVKIFESKEKI